MGMAMGKFRMQCLWLLIWSIFSGRTYSYAKIQANCLAFFWYNPAWSIPSWWSSCIMATSPCGRYIMVMLALICGYNCFWIMWCSLHVFSNRTSSICALVITPASQFVHNAVNTYKSQKINHSRYNKSTINMIIKMLQNLHIKLHYRCKLNGSPSYNF